MAGKLDRIVHSNWFSSLVLGLIILTSVLVGMETFPQFSAGTEWGNRLIVLQEVILWLFVVEAALKIASHMPRPWRYFLDPWNAFDFFIVAVCFLPLGAQYASVFRLARLARALRLITILPKLQLLVGALLKSIPALGYVGVLLFVHFYVYAVMGVFLFRENDPLRFGGLPQAMLTMFQILTLEGWNDILNTQYLGSDALYDEAMKELAGPARVSTPFPLIGPAYFVSFIMLGTMIMLNLFVGVIINGMEEAQSEADEEKRLAHMNARGFVTIGDELAELRNDFEKLQKRIEGIQARSRTAKYYDEAFQAKPADSPSN